jgi:DNA-binding transcriptional regulator YiaG
MREPDFTYRKSTCPHCGATQKVVDGGSLRKIREHAGLSVRAIARRLSMSAAYISDVELNRRNVTDTIFAAYLNLKKSPVYRVG